MVPRRPFSGIDLRDLELFVSVAEAGSITHGAERVHLSLPAASARLRAMESAVGAGLVVRGRRGVALTPAGRLLREHATTVLGQLERMRGDLTQFAEGLVASVRVQSNTSATETFLPGELTAFLADRPGVDVHLRERPSREVVHALARGEADLGIVASSADTGELVCERLVDDPLVLAVPAGHELAGASRVAFADCLHFALVGLGEGRALTDHLDELARPLGDRPLHRVRLPTLDDVCDAVAAGLGIAVVPRRTAAARADAGTLVAVDIDESWARRELLVCHAPRAALSTPARELHAHLTAGVSDGAP